MSVSRRKSARFRSTFVRIHGARISVFRRAQRDSQEAEEQRNVVGILIAQLVQAEARPCFGAVFAVNIQR